MTKTPHFAVNELLLELLEKHHDLFASVPTEAIHEFISPNAWQAQLPIPNPNPEDSTRLSLNLIIEIDDEGYFTGRYEFMRMDEMDVVASYGCTPLKIDAVEVMCDQLADYLDLYEHHNARQAREEPMLDMQRFVHQFAHQLHDLVDFPDQISTTID